MMVLSQAVLHLPKVRVTGEALEEAFTEPTEGTYV